MVYSKRKVDTKKNENKGKGREGGEDKHKLGKEGVGRKRQWIYLRLVIPFSFTLIRSGHLRPAIRSEVIVCLLRIFYGQNQIVYWYI